MVTAVDNQQGTVDALHEYEDSTSYDVRLLDKLMAKYSGREEHLIQKLTLRYDRQGKLAEKKVPTTQEDESYKDNNTCSRSTISGDSAYSGSSLDGTSPAVIAQISELLNYVYGKTTVPGQIDRVSTIMRAYEGREVVLLELLETKALLKANAQSEQQQMVSASQQQQQVTSPLSMSGPSVAVGGEFVGREMHDDMSSVSGASFKFNMKNFSDPTSPNNQNVSFFFQS